MTLKKILKKNFISVTEVSITNFKFDSSYQKAIKAKQVAEQNAKRAKNELEQIKVEAMQVEARASGQARALVLAAEAEAKAQKLIRETLTPEIVKLRTIEKWDGKLPTVSGGSSNLIDMSKLLR